MALPQGNVSAAIAFSDDNVSSAPMAGNDTSWVLVADGTRAKVIELGPQDRLVPEMSLQHELPGRKTERDGGDAASATEANHSDDTRSDPHRTSKQEFAREIAERPDRQSHARRFDNLIMVAPPVFLGLLRQEISKQLKSAVVLDLDKDLSKLPDEAIAAQVRARMEPG